MEIREVPVEAIQAYGNNPRRISEQAVKAVAESIREFGFKVPVVLDKNKVIVTGHTRLQAAQRLGLTHIPCVIADDLTPEQIKAFRLADNKTAELSAWDFDKLDIELEELENFDMEIFGFSARNYDDIAEPDEEIDTEKFSDDKFKHECPKCGFKF